MNNRIYILIILSLILFLSCSKNKDRIPNQNRSFSSLSEKEKIEMVRQLVLAEANYSAYLAESERMTKKGGGFKPETYSTYSVDIMEAKELARLYNHIKFYIGFPAGMTPFRYRLAVTDSGKIYLLTGFYKKDWDNFLNIEIKRINNVEEANKVFYIYKYLYHAYYSEVDSTSLNRVKSLFPKISIKLMNKPSIKGDTFCVKFYEWTDHAIADSLDKAFLWEYKMTIDKNANFIVKKKVLGERYVPF